MGVITLVDWGIWVVYLVLIFVLLWIYRSSKGESYYRYFMHAFMLKVAGGLGFALVYVYYYKFGDTFLYHKGATVLSQTLIDSPVDYFRLLASSNDNLPVDLSVFSNKIRYSNTYEEWAMVKLLSPINFISFQSYLVSTLFMSLLSFFGGWKLFLVFKDLVPKYAKYAFAAAFLVPSVIFWGGGIMKDTVTLFAINYLIYALYFGFFKQRFSLKWLVIALGMLYLIMILKAYIALAFLPGIFLGFYSLLKQRIGNRALRFVSGPVIFISLIGISYIGLVQITETSAKYQASNLEWQVKGFHSWHSDVGGSTYSLGEIDYTTSGVIQKIPAALNVTFFRPYLWEARNPVVLIGALESLFFLILSLIILSYYRRRIYSEIRQEPIIYGLFIFCLIFGFSVGFTSYNFGALARYKIPILSIFIFILLYLYSKIQQAKSDKNQA
jgi:hypothetical protein